MIVINSRRPQGKIKIITWLDTKEALKFMFIR